MLRFLSKQNVDRVFMRFSNSCNHKNLCTCLFHPISDAYVQFRTLLSDLERLYSIWDKSVWFWKQGSNFGHKSPILDIAIWLSFEILASDVGHQCQICDNIPYTCVPLSSKIYICIYCIYPHKCQRFSFSFLCLWQMKIHFIAVEVCIVRGAYTFIETECSVRSHHRLQGKRKHRITM